MLDLTLKQIENANFVLYDKNPVIRSSFPDVVIADPSVLTPEFTPDGKWRLFAHSLKGVYMYVSDDGVRFSSGKKILSRAMRPCACKFGDAYYIYYERLQPLFFRAAGTLGGKWTSEIYAVTSKDLKTFSPPVKVLGYDMPFEKAGKKGYSLSNPFVIKEDDTFRLYYSAGLKFIPDCKFSEPEYVCLAESRDPLSGFEKRNEPIIYPDENSEFFNMCCGCLKVYRLSDGYIGLQNGIYRAGDRSESAIQLLESDDGIKFRFVKTLLRPRKCGGSDWMAQFVYASHLIEYENKLRLYFNARNKAFILSGREHIGFAEADIPE